MISQNTFMELNPLKALSFSRSYCVQVCKQTFVCTGSEIVNEILMPTGYLAGRINPISLYIKRLRL